MVTVPINPNADLLTKPFTRDHLVLAVNGALQRDIGDRTQP